MCLENENFCISSIITVSSLQICLKEYRNTLNFTLFCTKYTKYTRVVHNLSLSGRPLLWNLCFLTISSFYFNDIYCCKRHSIKNKKTIHCSARRDSNKQMGCHIPANVYYTDECFFFLNSLFSWKKINKYRKLWFSTNINLVYC